MAEKHALINGSPAMHPKQIEALNEVNLVSEEFEKQYRDGVLEKAGRRRRRGLALRVVWVVLAVLAAWLLALTVVREVQLQRLRSEVRDLAADLLAYSATLRSIQENKFLKELQILDDPIYADEPERTSDKPESLGKLDDLTVVLEDDSNDRDVDDGLYDDEDDGDESGDWYQDFDKQERIGKTNMERLKPDDFMDAVVKEPSVSYIRKIKRLLNKNPETDIGSGTWHNIGLSKLSTSTEREPSSQERDRRSVLPADFASPNMVTSDSDDRKSKKLESEASVASKSSSPAPHSVSRTARNSEMEQRRPFIAAHFHGNTSHLNPQIHKHYKDNGLIRVPYDGAHDVWYPSAWTQASPHPRPTLTRNGHVHVHHTGVYFVYAQIYYLDRHDMISWVLHRTNPDQEGRDTLLQCAQSTHTIEPMDKTNSCFSASALFLRAGDRLAIRNTGGDIHSIMQPEKSFIGLIKLADADDPDGEF